MDTIPSKKAGLLEATRRGFYRITQEGLDVIAQKPIQIDVKYLKRFPKFQEFIQPKDEEEQEIASASSQSPPHNHLRSHSNTVIKKSVRF